MVKLNRRESQLVQSTLPISRIRFKFLQIVRRHESMKASFQNLKSQIKTGLLEAEDVFESLAIPLIKLVGLKTKEMADEGRSSTILMDSTKHQVSKLRVPARDKHQLLRLESEDESYNSRATKTCKELIEKHRVQLHQLVYLLRKIEANVSSRQENILQTLNNNRDYLHNFFQKAIFFLTSVHQKSQTEKTAHIVTLKLFRTTFEHVGSALCSVEGGVEDLMHELAENMCAPMVEYVNGLKTELAAGTMIRLTSAVEKMERVVKNSHLELEEARKKVRVEEKRKSEALIKLKEVEEKGKAMRDFVGHLLEATKKSKAPLVSHKILAAEHDQAREEKLTLDLLMQKRKSESQGNPMGMKDLLLHVGKCGAPIAYHKTPPTRVETTIRRRPVTRSLTKKSSPRTPSPNCRPNLRSSSSTV
ncbi:hypothetical protein GIB67_018873 [Kingdonia uniflora]|uniref:Uncharacterized protein n=1 Tax=Kingdonia uniflora TaxID=39325 RepID=A0A7J7MYY1_9MAGN|nr:hypothetical protein GIB67_018873 [Kingdonia uniflora]